LSNPGPICDPDTVNPASLRVLIIDDFQAMRGMLRQMLLSLGFSQITLAANASEALNELRRQRFDLVLCDYNLGEGLDGQQLLDQGRAEGTIDLATTFVMVTAENSSEMVMGALESAPDAYLSKPLTKDLLRARLLRAMRRRAPFAEVARVMRKNPESALEVLDRQLSETGEGRLDLLRAKADLARALQHWNKVEEAARAALDERPLAWAYTRLGEVAEARGEDAQAETLWRRAIKLTPQFMAAHDRLIALRERQGHREEALELLHQACERSAKSLARQRHLGELALAEGRLDLAAPAWLRVLSLSQQMGEARAADYHQAMRAHLARGDSRQARRLLSLLAKDCKGDPEQPWWLLAARLRMQGGSEEMRATLLAELERRLAEETPPPAAGTALGEALSALGETDWAARVKAGAGA